MKFSNLFIDKFNFFLKRWCSGEPNNWAGSDTDIKEGCGSLKGTCLNDNSCSTKFNYICEYKLLVFL